MVIRIAHFTDIHFTEQPARVPWTKLFSKRLLGWVNMVAMGRFADFADTAEIARALVADLQAQQLDGIVFTGDLTGLALESEFAAAKDALAPLLDDPRVLGIPGNHDVYTYGSRGAFERHFGPWIRSEVSGTDTSSTAPYPIVRTYGDEAAVIAVRDVRPCLPHDSSGYLPESQLAALRQRIAELPDRVIILAMHYCTRMPDDSRDSYLHRLRNDRQVAAVSEELGVDLIICGHVHHRSVHPSRADAPVAVANPGSVSHGRRSRVYHVLEIADGKLALQARRYDLESRTFGRWAEAPHSGPL